MAVKETATPGKSIPWVAWHVGESLQLLLQKTIEELRNISLLHFDRMDSILATKFQVSRRSHSH